MAMASAPVLSQAIVSRRPDSGLRPGSLAAPSGCAKAFQEAPDRRRPDRVLPGREIEGPEGLFTCQCGSRLASDGSTVHLPLASPLHLLALSPSRPVSSCHYDPGPSGLQRAGHCGLRQSVASVCSVCLHCPPSMLRCSSTAYVKAFVFSSGGVALYVICLFRSRLADDAPHISSATGSTVRPALDAENRTMGIASVWRRHDHPSRTSYELLTKPENFHP
ncbi:hypothetical protein B0J13DRAFT_607801 [Dactylonectria estremocensis]|uniref:Uncharacterized protein n=1 Tax=Dactylonectria estremocensis TaxID=1079267 RepID=A0A9P9EU14_9HYPO|nr:hypothetical protein B0J13DRAFT_607801 [Dactylonectria estremocensis]